MKITDLKKNEQNVFGGLVRMMIRSDGDFSEAEEEKINAIGESLGGAGLIWHTISESAQSCPEDDQIKEMVPTVTDKKARELILSVLEQVADSDGIATEEESLIEWVKKVWS